MTAMKRTDEKDTWMPEDFEVWKRKANGMDIKTKINLFVLFLFTYN